MTFMPPMACGDPGTGSQTAPGPRRLEHSRITSRHIRAILDLAAGGSGRRLDLPSGMIAYRRGRNLTIKKQGRNLPVD